MTDPSTLPTQALFEESAWMRRLARRLVVDEAGAEDAVQETLVAALGRERGGRVPGRAWLSTVLRNLVRRGRRDGARRGDHEQRFAEDQSWEEPGTDRVAERLEVHRRVAEAVDGLREPYRSTVWLRFLEGLPPREVARRLGVPVATVHSRVERALVQLRGRLDRVYGRREAWSLALADLARLPVEPWTWVGPLGVVTMGTITKWGGAAAAVVFAGLLWLDLGDGEAARQGSEELAGPPASPAALQGAGDPQPVAPSLEAPAEPASHGRVAADPIPAAAGAGATAGSVLIGRVVDETQAPLEGATVVLKAYQVWAQGHEVPRLPGPYDFRGWSTTTDAEGAFRFEVPVPSAPWTLFEIAPDPYHADHDLIFGGDRDDAQAPLTAGLRDLGTILLVGTGSIAGTVRDEGGLPIEAAELDVGPVESASYTYGHGANSDANGVFEVGHVPPGTYGVSVKAEGYLSEFLQPVEVHLARTTGGQDVVLRRAPALRGRVVDGAGAPIEGVRLWGWPASSGSGAGADTDAEGNFIVFLPQDEPYTLEATRDGYEPFGVGDRNTLYEPGTEGLEIVLRGDVTTTFWVLDDDTGKPIERFGLRILRNKGREATVRNNTAFGTPPRERQRPGGAVKVGARPGKDRYEVYARGYREARGEIVHDPDRPGYQTLRLRPGDAVTGRVVDPLDGSGIAGARVVLTPGLVQNRELADGSKVPALYPKREYAVRAITDEEGRFHLSGELENRTCALEVRAEQGALRRFPLEIRERVTDLGDLVLEPAATIEGRVLVPTGTRPSGLQVQLDGPRSSTTAVVDAQGRFRFEGVAAGRHTLDVEADPGVLVHGPPFQVELAAGEVRALELDLRDRAATEVRLRVDLSGQKPDDLTILLRDERSGEETELGQLNVDGLVIGWVRAGGSARVVLDPAYGAKIVHPTALLPLQAGVTVEEELHFELARLELTLGPAIDLPERCSLELTLGEQAWRSRFARDQNDIVYEGLEVHEGGRRLVFGLLPVGQHTFELQLHDRDAAEYERDASGELVLRKPPPLLERQLEVALRAGETTRVGLGD